MGMSLHLVGVLFPEITNKQADDEISSSHHESRKTFFLTDITFPHFTQLLLETLAIYIYIYISNNVILYMTLYKYKTRKSTIGQHITHNDYR